MATIEIIWLLVCALALVPLFVHILVSVLGPSKARNKVRTSLVLGSGGHTTELLKLVQSLDPSIYSPRTYYVAKTDQFGEQKVFYIPIKLISNSMDQVKDAERKLSEKRNYMDTGDYNIIKIPRSREVGQSFVASIPTTLWSCMACILPLLRDQPQLLLVNGPGTCVPIVLIVSFISMFTPCRIIYIESICRVTSLSMSARLVMPLVDTVLVQWPELAHIYPGTRYIGKFL